MTPEARTPGQLIQYLLDERGWNQRVLRTVLGIDPGVLSKIIKGKRNVSAELAIALEEIFEVPAATFLQLQQAYDLARARITVQPDPGRARRAHLFGGLPIGEMIKRGWLRGVDDISDVPKLEGALAHFFRVPAVDQIRIPAHAARKTDSGSEATPAQMAWLCRVREIASEMITEPYSRDAAKSCVSDLRRLLSAVEETRKVPRMLRECGVRFVVVESLPGAKIDGACLWLDAAKPVVAMSLRFDRIDNFWFVLRHELEHVLRGHGLEAPILDAELEGQRAGSSGVAEEERLANEAAADFCVTKKSMDSFIARKSPFFAERDILGFARTLKIHPGLVAGQLQNRTGRHDRFRNHLEKVREYVLPTAMVDGWGDIAPVD